MSASHRSVARLKRGLTLLVLCGVCGARLPSALAQQDEEEIICDPENPACIPAEEAAPAPPASEAGEEIICDPENPSCAMAPEGGAPTTSVAPVLVPVKVARDVVSDASFLVEWGSSIAPDVRWDTAGEDIVEWGSSLDATLSMATSSRSRVVLRAQLRHWMGSRRDAFSAPRQPEETRAELDVRLGESYWLYQREGVTLRAGTLITRWGSATLVRPNDVISPSDQRSFGMTGPALQDGKLAQPAIEGSWSAPGKLGISLIFVPFFVPDRAVLFGRDIALAQPRSPLATSFPIVPVLEQLIAPSSWDRAQILGNAIATPDETWRNPSAGARVTRTVWNTDLGASYHFGWDRTPRLEIDEDLAQVARIILSDEAFLADLDFLKLVGRHPELLMLTTSLQEKQAAGEALFVNEYQRRHTLSLDLSRYIGPVGVRFEGAFSPAQNFITTQLGTVRRPSLFGSLGLSYERLLAGEGSVALLCEGFLLQPWGADAALTRRFVSEEERGDAQSTIAFIGDRLYGVAAGGGVRWGGRLDLELNLGGVYNVSTGDVSARAWVRRGVGERLGVTLGGALYEGPPPEERLTLGGLYDDNDQAWLGLDGVF